MKKKTEAKKTAGKTTKAPVKTKAAEAKAPVKAQKKEAAPKKPARTRRKSEVTFQLKAPQAEQVSVVGYFNEWDPTATLLDCDEDGRWVCTLALDSGEHEYRFVVDGEWWDDPENMLRRPNGFGSENCIVIV
ncbi:MAG TPA: isoamylase early set domain-containing protein [Syntrophorhabdaceae bacterium]|nr:isoamylase early set domain-containing protein [Syntrophorhabdaceae bacterium]